MSLPLSTSSSDSEDQWNNQSLRSKKKNRKSSYFDRQKESQETKEPLLPTFLKQSEYNPFTSSSEEEEFDIKEKLFRNKPKPKTEKHKCRFVIALVFCGLIFLSVLVTILTIEILTKRQSVEDDSKNQTSNTKANRTQLEVENTTTMSRLTFNITSARADSDEDQPSTTELQIEGDTTSNPVTDEQANATELQVEDSTSAFNINTLSPEENDYPVEAVNNYDIKSSLEDYEYEYSYPSSLLSSYS